MFKLDMITALQDFPLDIGDTLYKVYIPEDSETRLYEVKEGTVCGIIAQSFDNDIRAQVRVNNNTYPITAHSLGKSYFFSEDVAKADALMHNIEILKQREERNKKLKERKENITVDMLLEAIKHCTNDHCEDCPLSGIKDCDEFLQSTLEKLLKNETIKESSKENK